MNDVNRTNDERVLEYQANKLQELIGELHNCCKERYTTEAKAFKVPQAELRCLMLFDGHKYLTGIEIAGLLEVAKAGLPLLLIISKKKAWCKERRIQTMPGSNSSTLPLQASGRLGKLKSSCFLCTNSFWARLILDSEQA
jgi:hypothetical protein